MKNLLNIMQEEGFSPALRTAGEYSSACPWCGGSDRFRLWPGKGETGRFWCRGCGRMGDSIQFLRDRKGLTYAEACQALSIERKDSTNYTNLRINSNPDEKQNKNNVLYPQGCERYFGGSTNYTNYVSARPTAPTWTPSPATTPPALWRERLYALSTAWAICLKNSGEGLPEPERARVLAGQAWLEGRGISPDTARDHGLGFCPWERFDTRENFGLAPELKPDGSPKKFWLCEGLAIPTYDQGGDLIRVRIRRFSESGPKYVALSGSCHAPMVLGEPGRPVVILESELDAVLLHQEAGDLAAFVALGSASIRPDSKTAALLREAPALLVALDSDDAGKKEARTWWLKHFPNAYRLPCIGGKDPGDAHQAGVNLRAWLEAGLDLAKRNRPP